MPANFATAIKWIVKLVEPPEARSPTIALTIACSLMISPMGLLLFEELHISTILLQPFVSQMKSYKNIFSKKKPLTLWHLYFMI